MATLLLVLGAGLWFLLAYHTFGRWLSKRVFGLGRADAGAPPTPAHRLEDGEDYVPTRRSVVFGHHFTSIAATGPIVGPAIAVIWGWLPALLWVVLGSVFIGAVHDLGSLAVSLRSDGRTLGDVAGRVLNRRVRLVFLGVLAVALTIILAIFGLVIAAVFRAYPSSILPVLLQVPLALGIGLALHRTGAALLPWSVAALLVMLGLVVFGDTGALGAVNAWFASWPTVVWVAALLTYCYVASVLPVWVLLQPRDYINALLLITTLGLVVVGLVAAGVGPGWVPGPGQGPDAPAALDLTAAPAVRWRPEGAPPMLPFLFITVACGAVSGFHCLVASGTSSKQLADEGDACFIGYGSMLLEAFLAVVVIVACTAGLAMGIPDGGGGWLTGEAAYAARYGSWASAGGLAAKVGAFVDGAANFLTALALPRPIAVAFLGVFVSGFAATTLDSATRLQRYVVQELAATLRASRPADGRPGAPEAADLPRSRPLNKHAATLIAVLTAGVLAALPAPGQPLTWSTAGTGGLILWPMFGAVNQLMAGIALLVIAVWLRRRGRRAWFIGLAAAWMLVGPAWTLIHQAWVSVPGGGVGWLRSERPNPALLILAALTLLGVAWIAMEAVRAWRGATPPRR